MATCEGTEQSHEPASVVLQPLHIDVTVRQESLLAKLLQSANSKLQPWIQSKGTATHVPGSSRLLVASWVAQIVLGILSIVLGGFLYICNYSYIVGSGAAFWTGAVAVLAGAAAFLQEKRGGCCWRFLKILLVLAAFSTAVAAINIGVCWYYWTPFHEGSYICNSPSSQGWPTPSPDSTQSPEETRRLHLCQTYMYMLVALLQGLYASLIGVWVLLLVASLVPLVPLASLCLRCWRRSRSVPGGKGPEGNVGEGLQP